MPHFSLVPVLSSKITSHLLNYLWYSFCLSFRKKYTMRLITTLTLATIFLILTSCQKEDIQPTTPEVTQQNPPNTQDTTLTTGNTTTDPDSTSTTGSTTTDPDSTTTNTTNEFSVLEFIKNENDFSLFYEALSRTGFKDDIGGDGPYTIFVPDNQAFQNFLDANNWDSLDDISPSVLGLVVQFHISNSEVMIGDLTIGTFVPILFNNKELFINLDNTDAPFVVLGLTQANITASDNMQTNGVVHRIDGVLSL